MLATDQRITDKGEDGKTEVKTFTNVTLEVTPRIAEKIAVGQSVGTLSLSLRSIADNASELERAVAVGRRQDPGQCRSDAGEDAPAGDRQPAQSTATPTFTTGGDVSRFQRRTVPAKPPRDLGGGSGAAPAQVVDGQGAPAPTGPTVKVARGNDVSVVPVGSR